MNLGWNMKVEVATTSIKSQTSDGPCASLICYLLISPFHAGSIEFSELRE